MIVAFLILILCNSINIKLCASDKGKVSRGVYVDWNDELKETGNLVISAIRNKNLPEIKRLFSACSGKFSVLSYVIRSSKEDPTLKVALNADLEIKNYMKGCCGFYIKAISDLRASRPDYRGRVFEYEETFLDHLVDVTGGRLLDKFGNPVR